MVPGRVGTLREFVTAFTLDNGHYRKVISRGGVMFPECRFSEVLDCLKIGDLAPTESRGYSGQNCLYDMSIVGNA
jgi:hypothetical protein